MVGAVALLPAPVVNNGGQVREVSVEVDVLGVVSTDVPGVVMMILTGFTGEAQTDTGFVQGLFKVTNGELTSSS